jgi:hypothetical protein
VQLLSVPGNVLPKGLMKFNLDPKLSTMTLMLHVTNSTGQQVTRSVIIETYDPNPKDSAATATPILRPAEQVPQLHKGTQKIVSFIFSYIIDDVY